MKNLRLAALAIATALALAACGEAPPGDATAPDAAPPASTETPAPQ